MCAPAQYKWDSDQSVDCGPSCCGWGSFGWGDGEFRVRNCCVYPRGLQSLLRARECSAVTMRLNLNLDAAVYISLLMCVKKACEHVKGASMSLPFCLFSMCHWLWPSTPSLKISLELWLMMCPLKIRPLMCRHPSPLIAVSPFYESLYFHRMSQLACSCQHEPRWQVRRCPWLTWLKQSVSPNHT